MCFLRLKTIIQPSLARSGGIHISAPYNDDPFLKALSLGILLYVGSCVVVSVNFDPQGKDCGR